MPLQSLAGPPIFDSYQEVRVLSSVVRGTTRLHAPVSYCGHKAAGDTLSLSRVGVSLVGLHCPANKVQLRPHHGLTATRVSLHSTAPLWLGPSATMLTTSSVDGRIGRSLSTSIESAGRHFLLSPQT
ncbi:hypothetical protein PsYK624_149260 [Phanerochaete sordida]|uniref:Uncharacterized protein n=1 Tax=Phanerochaete sordida TaxID=48140 RepID=A0A9P3GPB7_9APHY|nr:hypothetical protein PsYK624_149260 [Phanerochaete sordida]